ncbi:MAG: tRNA (N(6)-L-threonylcarbamoyladenosine(37)-C(2))-methylthiotransferase MtaB [Chloroflexota bacterium]|nr:tRNA (N(6)-L-threonylcarbamoyladenosine(37)-C(2))-methylthiotransferase MtaB [Chloroflexota bacterium]MBI5703204.1 tRNA (N(6)-L-threonylcarbamoyladenosine(37)-C(2))-methylthiotransferase MtaB [Chloroflexota bacterium]
MKVYLDTVGCRLNQSEIETMARQFRAAGHEVVASPETADLAVVNTCAVTNEAAADSRGAIRRIARAGAAEIIATGCWTTLHPKQAEELPNVRRVVLNDRKDRLVADLLNLTPEIFDLEPISREPLPGLHRRTRAFLKVQDGCDNHCTFCVTTIARGEGRSRRLADVLLDVQVALEGGAKEIVLTGVHLGSWGRDFGLHLSDLIQAILRETDVPRLRLSSLEPWDLSADFFSLWADARLMPHLHLPLQSGSASTLKRMLRKTTPQSFRELVTFARQAIPDVAITTDLIAGFPGETEKEFAETLNFVREMEFAGGHVFSYSPRPGTGAARMKGQIKPELRKKRNHILQEAIEESAKSYRERFIGKEMTVLWETASEFGEWGWKMEGLTGNYLRVTAFASSPRWNEIDLVRLERFENGRMKGVIVNRG